MSFIHRLNGPKNLTWQKTCNDYYCDYLDLGINLTLESPESSYTARVTSISDLGNASSRPSTFTYLDIGTFYFTVCRCHMLPHEHYFKNHWNVPYVIVSKEAAVGGK